MNSVVRGSLNPAHPSVYGEKNLPFWKHALCGHMAVVTWLRPHEENSLAAARSLNLPPGKVVTYVSVQTVGRSVDTIFSALGNYNLGKLLFYLKRC